MSTRRAISHLIVVAIVLTPIFGLHDWLEIIPAFGRHVNIESQVAIKAAKDVLLGLVLLLFLLDVMSGRSFLANPLIWAMASLAVIAALITSGNGKPFLALIGLRSLSPLLLIFIAYSYLDMAFMRKLLRVLLFVLVIEYCAAVFQLFLGVPISGRTFFNLAARPFGTFANPWSLAAFICFVLCFKIGWDVHQYGRLRRMTRVFVLVAAFFVYLIGSGAGVLTLAVILGAYFLFLWKGHPYAKAAIAPSLLLAPVLAFYSLRWLTGRQDIYSSVHSRLGILKGFLSESGLKEVLIGKDMGLGSNAAVTLTRLSSATFGGVETLFISDSLYISLASQVGFVFLFCFLGLNILLFQKAVRHRYQSMNPVAIMMIPAVMVASLGNNVLELFPVNWLMCIVYGLVLRTRQTSAGYWLGTVRRTSGLHSCKCEALA